MAELSAALVLALTAFAYAVGVRRAWRQAGAGRLVHRHSVMWFTLGLVTIAAAVLPPMDGRADASLTAHMIQHVLLLAVAAPLLVLGEPLPALLFALPDRWRGNGFALWRRLLRTRSGRGWATWVACSLVVQSAVMWAWHTPVLYQAALDHEPLHGFEHACFLVTAGAFWWAVGLGGRRPRGSAVIAVFVAALPGTGLGAALTLANHPWYAQYPSLADQQMAGVVMWAFGGLAYILAAAVVFGTWLAGIERDSPARPLISGVPI